MENLRSDLSAFADLTAANVDVSTADRQKLLERIERCRHILVDRSERVEHGSDVIGNNADRIFGLRGVFGNIRYKPYARRNIVEIRIYTLPTMPSSEDVATIRDNVAAVLDAVRALSDSLNGGSAASDNTLEQDLSSIALISATTDSSEPLVGSSSF